DPARWPADPPLAREGSAWCEIAWSLAAAQVAAELELITAEPAVDTLLDRLATHPTRDGSLLHADASDNPETRWYHELILLHGVGNLAQGRPEAWPLVERAVEFHQAETQFDHATTEPWGLWVFARHGHAGWFAGEILHAVQTRWDQQPDAVSLILLSDSLYWLSQPALAED